MGILGVNEAAFNTSLSYKDKAITTMSDVSKNVSSVSIPSGYENTGEVENVLEGISTNISPKLEKYGKDFIDFQNYFMLLKNSEESTDIEPNIIRDSDGNIIGLQTVDGYISLDGFQKIETENGTSYIWMDQKNSNFNISCNIYIPKVKELKGIIMYFTDTSGLENHDNYRQIIAGEYQTDSIIFMPHNDDIYETDVKNPKTFAGISTGLAQLILEDVQNLATSFGIDKSNISTYGFSSGAKLAANMISGCPEGSFKNIVMAGNTDVISSITDPGVRVIVLSGAGEGENASFVKGQLDAYSSTHDNETEYYILDNRADGKRVTHVYLDDTAATTDIFDGKNIFQYLGDNGESAPSPTPTETVTPTTESTSTPSGYDYNKEEREEMLKYKKWLSENNKTTTTEEETDFGLNIDTEETETPVPVEETLAVEKPTPSPAPKPRDNPAPVVSTPSPTPEPTYILPENKFSDLLPNLTSGNLDSMEISAVHANYDISGISDEIYNNYINSLKEAGYTLGTDGSWIKDNYILNLVRNNTDLNIYFKINI